MGTFFRHLDFLKDSVQLFLAIENEQDQSQAMMQVPKIHGSQNHGALQEGYLSLLCPLNFASLAYQYQKRSFA